jgi:hypothetical protein
MIFPKKIKKVVAIKNKMSYSEETRTKGEHYGKR